MEVGDQECCDAIANQPNDSASLQAACSASDSTTYEYQYNTDWHVTSNGCLRITKQDGIFVDEYVVEDQECCDN